jgi:diguanylate cyclase (GGDEF)-like protein
MRSLVVGAALALPLAGPAEAATRRPLGPLQLSFELLDADDGLESSAVRDLAQDAAGNLWLATRDGVVRYDGEQFVAFGRRHGLPSSDATELELDGEGTLWVATGRGLARRAGKEFAPVGLAGSPPGEPVGALALDREGRLLAGAGGGVWRCRARACERIFETPSSQRVAALARDPNLGEIWIAGPFGLVRWNGQEIERWDETRGLSPLPIRALLADRRGRLWIRQGDDTLRLDTTEGEIETLPGLPPATESSRLFEDRRGVVWATSERGLFFRRSEAWARLGVADGLPSDALSSLLEDFEGSLWLGTAWDGIARWKGRERFTAWTKATGLPDEVVGAIARLDLRRIAFGTSDGLALADLAANELTLFGAGDLPGARVTAVEPDGAGGAWLGFEASGLAHLDAGGRVTAHGARQGLPAGLAVRAIDAGADGSLWLATDLGLWRGEGRATSRRFERERLPGDLQAGGGAAPAEPFHDLHRDPDGTLWAAGRRGVARLARGAWRRFTAADGLADDDVVSITATGDGTHWLAYRQAPGIAELRLDGEEARVRGYDRRSGIAHDQATLVRADRLGRLWVGTARGVSVRTGDRFASFDRRDGMRGDDVRVNAFHADSDGTVWLGTTHGAIALRLSEQDLGPPLRPAARIRFAALGGIPFGSDERPEVGYEQRDFEVGFGAKTFLRSPRELEYRYQLSGVDREPVVTSNRSHTYGALFPGSYGFTVEARLRGGAWGPPAALAFTIRPPWWGRAPAQIVALLAAALFGVLVDRARGRRTRRREKELEEAVAARTRELKASREELARKNDELAQLALTDALTGIKNRRFAWEVLAQEVARVDREWQAASPGSESEARLVFFLMDVDLFKGINDRHGHEIGDQILIEAAERVRAATRLSDFAIRWGGEEFLIIARDLPRADWAAYAAKLREAVAKPPYQPSAEVGEVACTASLGYAAYPFDGAIGIRWQQVLHLADLALYAVKQCGRNADLGVEPGAGWSGSIPVDLLAAQMAGTVTLRWSSARARRR